MHRDTIVDEFTHQAQSFNRSAVANAPELLDRIVDIAQPAAHERWLDVACGPGAITRALARHVAEVHGVDTTPAMVALAAREAAVRELTNVSFSAGDATMLDFPEGSFAAAVTRFSLHHIPAPGRVVAEMARVVAPEGRVVICDSVADEDIEAYAYSQEIERLRDPSHWASLTRRGLHAAGTAAGLTLECEELVALQIDFDDWLARGSGRDNAQLIDQVLARAPASLAHFQIRPGADGRVIDYRVAITRWRR